MAFTNLFYTDPTAFALNFPAPAVPFLVKVIESADAADMEARVQEALDEVTALNVLIAAAFPEGQDETVLTLADADLAGGGDGHTFLMTLYFVPGELNAVQTVLGLTELDMIPGNLLFKFAIGGSDDELLPVLNDAIVRAANGSDTRAIFQFVRGSAKGTRFMYGVGGLAIGLQ